MNAYLFTFSFYISWFYFHFLGYGAGGYPGAARGEFISLLLYDGGVSSPGKPVERYEKIQFQTSEHEH